MNGLEWLVEEDGPEVVLEDKQKEKGNYGVMVGELSKTWGIPRLVLRKVRSV